MSEHVVILTVLGASVGSFLNVCAFRIPIGMSVVPRSFCPVCHSHLRWFEVVPLLSFVVQGGRCRTCSSKIPLRYLLVELLTAGLALSLFAKYGMSQQFVIAFSFVSLMFLVAIIDWQYLLIPNKIIAVGIIAGVVQRSVFTIDDLFSSLIAMTFAFGILLLIRVGGSRVFEKEVMGMGDVKLGGVIGLFIGLQGFLVALWGAAAFGSLFGLVRSIIKGSTVVKASGESLKLPFGSFLALASCVVLLLYDQIFFAVRSWLVWIQ